MSSTKECAPPDTLKVDNAKRVALEEAAATSLSDVLRVLADPTRIRIISALSGGELCVCEIASALGLSQSLVSHQLRAMRHLRLVKMRDMGRNRIYSVNSPGALRIIEECKELT